jgi:predicted DNA-binding transcriptional regulator AlpA
MDIKYVNEKEVSRITGLGLPTLRNYRHIGKGPTYSKIGRSVRYELADVVAYMEERKVKTKE